jgi:hypothetical protein
MMGQLYERAVHVLACVGSHANNSEYLLQTIDRNHALLSYIHEHLRHPDLDSLTKGWTIANPIPRRRWLAVQCFFAIEATSRKLLAEAFLAFIGRPYFSRVWVLQELHLASKISVCCGTDVRSFDYLLAISMLVDFWVNEHEYVSCWQPITRKLVSLLSHQNWTFRRQKSCKSMQYEFSTIQPQRGCLALASGVREPRRLSEVIDAMQHFYCSDVRDRLYGVLSLVHWQGGFIPAPDYGLDRFEVAQVMLALYLADEIYAPVSGTVMQWAGRICNAFEISLEQNAMREAISQRCTGSCIPGAILATREHLAAQDTDTYPSYMDAPRLDLFNSDLQGHNVGPDAKNTWYGVRLQAASFVVDEQSSAVRLSRYLCCWPSQDNKALTTIFDQDGNLYAFASKDTRAGDWLLTSFNGSLTMKNALNMTVRASGADAGRYSIVGHAAMYEDFEGDLFSFHAGERFQAHWHPEDLLLFAWNYIHRVSCARSWESIADWLNLNICANKGSSWARRHAPRRGNPYPPGSTRWQMQQWATAMGTSRTRSVDSRTPLLEAEADGPPRADGSLV